MRFEPYLLARVLFGIQHIGRRQLYHVGIAIISITRAPVFRELAQHAQRYNPFEPAAAKIRLSIAPFHGNRWFAQFDTP